MAEMYVSPAPLVPQWPRLWSSSLSFHCVMVRIIIQQVYYIQFCFCL